MFDMTDDEELSFFGKIPVRTEITVLPADECKVLKLGIIFSESTSDVVAFSPGFLGHKRVRTVIIE